MKSLENYRKLTIRVSKARMFRRNRANNGHWYFEFEICLEFDAWNLEFQRFRERLRLFLGYAMLREGM